MHEKVRGYLRPKDAAQYARVTRQTIYNWMNNGMEHRKKGRSIFIKPEWIDAWLNEGDENKPPDIDKLYREAIT